MEALPVNWLAVFGAAAIRMVVGAIWYSPFLFRARWVALIAPNGERVPAGVARGLVLDLVMSLIMAFILSAEIHFIGTGGALAGGVVGLANWLGFVFTIHATLFIHQGRPLELMAIDSGYSLLALVLMGALLGTWP